VSEGGVRGGSGRGSLAGRRVRLASAASAADGSASSSSAELRAFTGSDPPRLERNGANWARILVGILEVTNVAAGLYLLVAWSGTYIWNGIWQIGIALLVLYFLFGSRGDEFFSRRAT
jgi:hypothetical protein